MPEPGQATTPLYASNLIAQAEITTPSHGSLVAAILCSHAELAEEVDGGSHAGLSQPTLEPARIAASTVMTLKPHVYMQAPALQEGTAPASA